jgi:hypothetical protein
VGILGVALFAIHGAKMKNWPASVRAALNL